jgi:hypothetical protein
VFLLSRAANGRKIPQGLDGSLETLRAYKWLAEAGTRTIEEIDRHSHKFYYNPIYMITSVGSICT